MQEKTKKALVDAAQCPGQPEHCAVQGGVDVTKRTAKTKGLMFPKEGAKRKKAVHAKASILQPDRDRRRCWLCMRMNGDYSEHALLHKHHVFMGPLRRMSEAGGFFVWLCPQHHEFGPDAVHVNAAICKKLQGDAQTAFEKTHTREEFTKLAGRSYL